MDKQKHTTLEQELNPAMELPSPEVSEALAATAVTHIEVEAVQDEGTPVTVHQG